MTDYIPVVIEVLSNPLNLLLLVASLIAGIIVGALPGLTVTMALALLLPFTFSLPADTSLIAMGGLYIGGMFGGCISAILINTPGTPSAIATTFDGYPMARSGKPHHAIVTAVLASGIGGIIGALALLFLTPLLSSLSLAFGPPEYFWVAMLGLSMIATLSSGSMLKGLIGGCLGLLLGTIGIAPIGGESRFTFGLAPLVAGLELTVVLIAFFCIPEVLRIVENRITGERIAYRKEKGVVAQMWNRLIRRPFLLLRSSVIGVIVGIIPGAGGNVASIISYDAAVKFSKDKKAFGKGSYEGVAASESANNAEVGGSLVPLLSLGIPGAPPAAIMMGALMIHGITPGPGLFTSQAGLVYTFLWAFLLANVLLIVLGLYLSGPIGRIINIRMDVLIPVIIFLSTIGAFAIRNNFTDVVMMVIIGLAAYLLSRLGFHPAPIVLGLILGPIAEVGLTQSILIGQAKDHVFAFFFTRPVSVVLMVLCALSIAVPLADKWLRSRRGSGQRQGKEEAE
ncbi:tripartite tricarboxylate transporter permease [Paenibacillus tarimensis]|uniref:tripartite tricarboxylate transporter permease n=1 Tax=Paenibacillus tarimensis TaxID=416012 RepID=UPI001F30DEAC|nr:tripartite tricarboxylate transporter permease [Paenibacillus tarimensis]MCF2944561.1 tripartite tricarboxylate transporter permease [Paenibacillus tarimensis]